MTINIKDFHTTVTDPNYKMYDIERCVYDFIVDTHRAYSMGRDTIEDNWLSAWALYLNSSESTDYSRDAFLVGNVKEDWRHRLNTGKAYEVIETVHGYLMSALFPNRDWFSVVPSNPGYIDTANLVKKYIALKMSGAGFRACFETYLRQLLICGMSAMAIPWRYETREHKALVKLDVPDDLGTAYTERTETRTYKNEPDYRTLDMMDVYVDPCAEGSRVNDSNFLRRIKKTRAAIIQDIADGYYENLDEYSVANYKCNAGMLDEPQKRILKEFQGIKTDEYYSMHDMCECYEFWGDVSLAGITFHDVCATICCGELVRFEPNPYWAGKPFIIGTLTELVNQPYAIGLVQPNLGLLQQLNIITNQRLDNLELSINSMWTIVQDGVLQPEDVYTEPGRVFPVSSHDDLRPIINPQQYTVSYQEAGYLETTIDKNAGTGMLVSANSARSGERVTAAEIQAVRDAGGNRLSNVHRHIEDTSLILILTKTLRLIQQFVRDEEVIRVVGSEPGSFHYYSVSPDDLNKDYVLTPIGADYMVERDKYVNDRLNFINSVSKIPQMAELIDYAAILFDITAHFGFDNASSYLKPRNTSSSQPELPSRPEQVPVSPGMGQSPIDETLKQLGGKSLQQAVSAEINADGGNDLAQKTLGMPMMAQGEQPQ